MVKKIVKDIVRYKGLLWSWIGEINVGKVAILSKLFYTLNSTQYNKIIKLFFSEIDRNNTKFVQNTKDL